MIDFLEYSHLTPGDIETQTQDSWKPHLLVHVVSRDRDVLAIDLGDAHSLAELVQTWRADLGQSDQSLGAAKELRTRIWDPIEEHLGGIQTVYVSPDGVLGQFPLAALPGRRPESYLIEDYAIVMLPVPQQLPEIAKSMPVESSADKICLVGGVDYEPSVPPQNVEPADTVVRPGRQSSPTWHRGIASCT